MEASAADRLDFQILEFYDRERRDRQPCQGSKFRADQLTGERFVTLPITHSFEISITGIGRHLNDLGAARITVDHTLDNSRLPITSALHVTIGEAVSRIVNEIVQGACSCLAPPSG